MKIHNLYLYLFLFSVNFHFAQQKIGLEEAFALLKTNNYQAKLLELQETKLQNRIGSERIISPLSIGVEYGQMNSIYQDNRISIQQTLQLPRFYNSQKKVLELEWKNFAVQKKINEWDLKKQLEILYNEDAYLLQKKHFLQKYDSIFTQYDQKAKLRLKKGESNLLENTNSENWKMQIKMQLELLESDQQLIQHRLNFLLNSKDTYTFQSTNFSIISLKNSNLDSSKTSFFLLPYLQDITLQDAKISELKAKNLPSFNIGINSMTMYGNGADNRFYQFGTRFNSIMAGISLPLFNKGNKALIESQKISKKIAEMQYQQQQIHLDNQLKEKLLSHQRSLQQVKFYIETAQKNQHKIVKIANEQLLQGDIQFLEWAMLINQVYQYESDYYDHLRTANLLAIEINALSNAKN